MKELLLFLVLIVIRSEAIKRIESYQWYKPFHMSSTRRILNGRIGGIRPYMVYLRPTSQRDLVKFKSHWLCGGVIIHELYILTSAACTEDVKNFLVISGTHKWIAPEILDNECIKNGAKKAIRKIVPKSRFHNDDANFYNIRWMVSDIAVVKVEDEFNFERKIKGCDFIPKKIQINKFSLELEKSGTIASIAGWGSTERYTKLDVDTIEKAANSVDLLEADVIVITKSSCTKRWDKNYHEIINDEMICTKSNDDFSENDCKDAGAKCKGIDDDEEYFDHKPVHRTLNDSGIFIVQNVPRNYTLIRKGMLNGGFCQNDHGGPLIVGEGKNAIVTGIMSACLTKNYTNKCYGPFLFTSVYKHKNLISTCVLEGDTGEDCKKLLSSTKYTEKLIDWAANPYGIRPARFEKTNINTGRIYAETPREPQWPQPTITTKYDASKLNIISSQQTNNSQNNHRIRKQKILVNFNKYKLTFNISKSQTDMLTSRVQTPKYNQPLVTPGFTNKSQILPSSSKPLIKINLTSSVPLRSQKSLTYDMSTQKPDIYSPKQDVYTSKSDIPTLIHDILIPKYYMTTPNSDMYTQKSDINTPKYDIFERKSLADSGAEIIFNSIRVRMWDIHTTMPEFKLQGLMRRANYQKFENKSLYLKNMRAQGKQ